MTPKDTSWPELFELYTELSGSRFRGDGVAAIANGDEVDYVLPVEKDEHGNDKYDDDDGTREYAAGEDWFVQLLKPYGDQLAPGDKMSLKYWNHVGHQRHSSCQFFPELGLHPGEYALFQK